MAKKEKKTILLKIAGQEKLFFEGAVDFVMIPALDGDIGVVPEHAPFISPLREGRIDIRQGEDLQQFHVKAGFVEVSLNHVHILVHSSSEIE